MRAPTIAGMGDEGGKGPGAGGRQRLRAGNRIVQAGRGGAGGAVGFRNGNAEERREGHGDRIVGRAGSPLTGLV